MGEERERFYGRGRCMCARANTCNDCGNTCANEVQAPATRLAWVEPQTPMRCLYEWGHEHSRHSRKWGHKRPWRLRCWLHEWGHAHAHADIRATVSTRPQPDSGPWPTRWGPLYYSTSNDYTVSVWRWTMRGRNHFIKKLVPFFESSSCQEYFPNN